MKSIEILNLSKTYFSKFVLQDITWDIPAGSISALIGLNGSGKTTLLRILAGLIKPTNGDARIFSEEVTNFHSIKGTSFMFEPSPIDNMLTAYQNLKLKCLIMGEPLGTINQLISMVGLKRSNVLVKNYSIGMKKRLELAYSLIGNPDLLILDEPFDGLDITGVEMLKNILLDYKNSEKTVLITEHNFSLLEDITDHFAILYDRKIIASLSQNEITNKFGNLETAFKEIINQYDKSVEIRTK